MQRRHQTCMPRKLIKLMCSLVKSIVPVYVCVHAKRPNEEDKTYSMKTISFILTFNQVTWKSIERVHSPAGATSVPNIVVSKVIEHTTLPLQIDQRTVSLTGRYTDKQRDRHVQHKTPSLSSKERHKYIILVNIIEQSNFDS